jgi:hypothetical protein
MVTTSKASIAAVIVSLFLLVAPAAQADEADQIAIAPTARITPEGWAKVKLVYSCAPRVGSTHIDMNIVETWGPDGEYTSSFDDLSPSLTCDGASHTTRVIAGGDFDPYVFYPGPAQVEAAFWNDVLGGWQDPTGFGPHVEGTVLLR